MTKRKAKSQATAARGGKQARTSEAASASAASSSASASSPSSFAAGAPSAAFISPLAAGTTSCKAALCTLDLVNAMRGAGSVLERVKATCAILKEDGERAESLLDMSLLVDGEEAGSVCTFFHLMRLYGETAQFDTESADAKKLKLEMQNLLFPIINSTLPHLLSSFNPAITDAATGNNALHLLLSRIMPTSSTSVPFIQLIGALIEHGVDIQQRNKGGRTVALAMVEATASWFPSACGLQLLLQHGADINAQDNEGNTLLHHLTRQKALRVLRDLLGGDMSGLDFFVLNRAGQTPADLAVIKLAEEPNDANCQQIQQLMRAQVEMWRLRVRPAVLCCLEEWLIPDVAKLALGYVDGSGLAFVAAEAAAAGE